tara:strand:- start:240 stop:461 length:222 start_codon:yes stop_codon:yes gene_type:complete
MIRTPYSLELYEEVVAHANLKLMTKLTDNVAIVADSWPTAKEQSEAFRKAWIANTEVKLLKRKIKLIPLAGRI